jgi:hypothetical protein
MSVPTMRGWSGSCGVRRERAPHWPVHDGPARRGRVVEPVERVRPGQSGVGAVRARQPGSRSRGRPRHRESARGRWEDRTKHATQFVGASAVCRDCSAELALRMTGGDVGQTHLSGDRSAAPRPISGWSAASHTRRARVHPVQHGPVRHRAHPGHKPAEARLAMLCTIRRRWPNHTSTCSMVGERERSWCGSTSCCQPGAVRAGPRGVLQTSRRPWFIGSLMAAPGRPCRRIDRLACVGRWPRRRRRSRSRRR